MSGLRASIPSGMRKTIQNIKEITGNHSDDEIYAMLKECSMDPNETAQKLLFQDTFHEVKRKRDRRKENVNNKESLEPRSKPGTQGRGIRGGRGNFPPYRVYHDAGGGKNSGTGKDNGTSQGPGKGVPPLPGSQETKAREKISGTSSVPATANGPTTVASRTTSVTSLSSTGNVDRISASAGGNNDLGNSFPSDSSDKSATVAFGSEAVSSTSDCLGSRPASSSAVCFSSSDPILVPSNDSHFPGAVGAIKREVGSQRPPGELNVVHTSETKATALETGSSSLPGKVVQGKSSTIAKNHVPEVSSSSTVIHGSTSAGRPSSNYSNRSQQIGLQRAGSNKEWKPKPTNTINQGSGPASVAESSALSAEANGQLPSVSKVLDSEEAVSKLQTKLEDLHLAPRQHVILPNHILVPDSEKSKFSFGSLGVTFGVTASYVSGLESEKNSTPLSKVSQAVEETAGEQASSNQNASITSVVGDDSDNPQSHATTVPENLSSSAEVDVSSSARQEENEGKHDPTLPSEANEYPVVHMSPNYNLGLMPPMLGTQSAQIDNSESHARDISRPPSYVVQQPFDPSYYAQFYRSGADSDDRLSPLPSAGTTKYNGNVALLPAPSSQSLQEGGVLSTAGPTPAVTQASGLMQNSIGVAQQPLPVFRPPTGVHLSHYSPNYIPYGHYFSPFYVPPQAMHQFMGNGAFPQQPQASTVYPSPQAVAASGMKYPLPQFKPGTNAANSTHFVMPGAYGAYGSSPAGGYNPSSAATAGNSTSNEDHGSSQFKENNVYLNGQQSEGSAMWVAAPGRDISSMPTSSFYNLTAQGQHVTFAPTQAGHGTFAGIYHPGQAVTAATVHPLLQQSQTMAGAVDMAGPGGNVYQQSQHAHINWPGNY